MYSTAAIFFSMEILNPLEDIIFIKLCNFTFKNRGISLNKLFSRICTYRFQKHFLSALAWEGEVRKGRHFGHAPG